MNENELRRIADALEILAGIDNYPLVNPWPQPKPKPISIWWKICLGTIIGVPLIGFCILMGMALWWNLAP